jgi:hypothetical protein
VSAAVPKVRARDPDSVLPGVSLPRTLRDSKSVIVTPLVLEVIAQRP